MKLSLDIFQVLGVSPGTSARNLLTLLDRRLERCEYQGFSLLTLSKRKKLLNAYSKILMDADLRKEIESRYLDRNGIERQERSISLEEGNEVAGLLLILEAGQHEECLFYANELRSDKKYIAGKNGIDAVELDLLIGYATLDYAKVLKAKRYYEQCSRILEKGLRTIQNKSGMTEIEQHINRELENIVPFRILDLLSRDMDEPVRVLGISLLDDFVTKRGGLDHESDLYMNDREFKSFFRQIRYFLTVQEQIDMFQKWCKQGSQAGCFLHGISLVASGFAQRKPERLLQALTIMKDLNHQELEEVIQYIRLLLGDISIEKIEGIQATNMKEESSIGAGADLELSRLCSACREWLEKDVLEGYRDLEADSDLETYFGDSDVTAFIEEQDKKKMAGSNWGKSNLKPTTRGHEFSSQESMGENKLRKNIFEEGALAAKTIQNTKAAKGLDFIINKKKELVILATVISIGLCAVFFAKQNTKQQKNVDAGMEGSIEATRYKPTRSSPGLGKKETGASTKKNNTTPDETEIKALLTKWLKIKAQRLAGGSLPLTINEIATSSAIKRLESERKDDDTQGHRQRINAHPLEVVIRSRSEKKIEFEAKLTYSDERIDRGGRIIESTPNQVFKKTYILVNEGPRWLLQ